MDIKGQVLLKHPYSEGYTICGVPVPQIATFVPGTPCIVRRREVKYTVQDTITTVIIILLSPRDTRVPDDDKLYFRTFGKRFLLAAVLLSSCRRRRCQPLSPRRLRSPLSSSAGARGSPWRLTRRFSVPTLGPFFLAQSGDDVAKKKKISPSRIYLIK